VSPTLLLLAACVSIFPAKSAPPADKIAVQMRVEGTIMKRDSPFFNVNPYAKDRVPYAHIPQQFGGGDLYVEVVQGKERAAVALALGGDKELKAQAEKLAGKRVVVECRGEYRLYAGKVTANIGRGPEEIATVIPTVTLTVTKIAPAD
jgi:hypothetical protein